VRLEGLGNLIKVIHLIGSRTRDLPVCNVALERKVAAPVYKTVFNDREGSAALTTIVGTKFHRQVAVAQSV
jgi:hypothetical protein